MISCNEVTKADYMQYILTILLLADLLFHSGE